jgi:protein-tyrosine phosphatase
MEKILFVCLGNICRSPVAEGIMLHLIGQHKLHQKISVDSAGTAGYHVDEAPDRRTVQNAKKNGVDLSKLRARKFSKGDFDSFDRIFVMDENNFRDVVSMTQEKDHHAKVDYLLNVSFTGQNLPVPDPYYGQETHFEEVFQLVYKACQKLIEPHIK